MEICHASEVFALRSLSPESLTKGYMTMSFSRLYSELDFFLKPRDRLNSCPEKEDLDTLFDTVYKQYTACISGGERSKRFRPNSDVGM